MKAARAVTGSPYNCRLEVIGANSVAPTKILRNAGDRIKTDRRDALSLAHFIRAVDLTLVTVPAEPDETIRYLSRAREDSLAARVRARHQLKAMLLRYGDRHTDTTSFTAGHNGFLAEVRLPILPNRLSLWSIARPLRGASRPHCASKSVNGLCNP